MSFAYPPGQGPPMDDIPPSAGTAALIARFPLYQIDFSAQASGKRIATTKRRIRWRWGFTNKKALEQGLTGTDCRGEEHDIIIIWSLTSGKRQVTMDGHEVHFSTNRSGVLDFSWSMRGNHVVKLIAHASPPLSHTPGFRQYDLSVDGQSFFNMPKVFEIGLRGIPPPVMPRSPADYGGQSRVEALPPSGYDEERDIQRAIQASIEDSRAQNSRSYGNPLPASAPAPTPLAIEPAADLLGFDGAPTPSYDSFNAGPYPSSSGFAQHTSSHAAYGQPPPAAYGQPPSAGYGQPPPAGYGQPPPAGYGQPPPDAYGQPPGALVPYGASNGYGAPAPYAQVPPSNAFAQSPAFYAPAPYAAAPPPVYTPAPFASPQSYANGQTNFGSPDAQSFASAPNLIHSYEDPFAPKAAPPPNQYDIHNSILGAYGTEPPSTPSAGALSQPNFGTPQYVSPAPAPPVSLSMVAPLTLTAAGNDASGQPKSALERAMQNLVNFDDLTAPAEAELTRAMQKQEEEKKKIASSGKSKALPPVAKTLVGSGATLGQIQTVKNTSTLKDPSVIMKNSTFQSDGVNDFALVVHGQGPPPLQKGYGGAYGVPYQR